MYITSDAIAKKNDWLRRQIPLMQGPHRFMRTRSVASLPEQKQLDLLSKVVNFNDFNEDNNPHGEHDFFSIVQDGQKYFLKIDYYDKNFKFHEENGIRVITLMHSSDY